jgi:aryl-alcohol dehydrogenase-like predicted oxidoreductase
MLALGRCDLRVSRVVFGAMAYASADGDAPFRIRTLHAAIDAGITTIDTAPLYGSGRSETLVGHAIADRRDRVQILTKVGLRWDDAHGEPLFSFDDRGKRITVRKDSRPASIRRDVEDSLRRLGIERIDLCQIHHPDVHTPIEDTMGALANLRREGKIGHIGVSNFSIAQVEAAQTALGEVPLCAHQLELNPLRRATERDRIPHAVEHGLGVLAYAPLHHGLLAGRGVGRRRLGHDDDRRFDPAFASSNTARVAEALRQGVTPVAARHGVTISECVLGWVLSRRGVTAVIVGASSPQQARLSARAAQLELDAEDLARITRAFDAVVIDHEARPTLAERLVGRAQRAWTRVVGPQQPEG